MTARGAAWRRRQRRLRSMLRHERQTFAMELAGSPSPQLWVGGLGRTTANQRGSCQVLRIFLGRWQARWGRAGHPVKVSRGVLRVWCTRLVRCTTVPSLVLAELGGGREEVDSSALVFLVSRAVEDRRKEEAEKAKEEVARMERIENLILVGAPVSCHRQSGLAPMGFGDQEERRSFRRLPPLDLPRSGTGCARSNPTLIMEGLVAAVSRRDQGAVFGQGFLTCPLCCYVRCYGPDRCRKLSNSLRCSSGTRPFGMKFVVQRQAPMGVQTVRGDS